jgi:CcmD family protein
MNRPFLFLAAFLLSLSSFAQAVNPSGPQMADAFREEGKIYIVITVISIIFICLAVYLFSIDRKLNRIEKELKEKN